jgi:hypothetical protein
MGIQDLGAIGEFISSLVIVVTLMVLIYEVRGAKNATLQANAQERQRKLDDYLRSVAESPDLAGIIETANQHLGGARLADPATEFGLERDQYARLYYQNLRVLTQARDAYVSSLPEDERLALDALIAANLSVPSQACRRRRPLPTVPPGNV